MARFGPAFPPLSSNKSQAPPRFEWSSSGSSYRPSVHIPSSTSTFLSRYSNPSQHLDSQISVRNKPNAPSSLGSRTQDSQSIIAGLHRQISNLKKQVRDKTPAKERPRRGREKDDRENSEASSNAHIEVGAEIPSPTKKIPGSIHSKRPSKSPSQHLGGDALPPKVPKRRGNRGEQGAVWKALDQISSSPFSKEIERAQLPPRYTTPGFEVYNGRTDPVAHIEVALRWFNQIDRGTIASWDQMAEAFVGRFITNSRRPKDMDVLMTMKLGDNETIKNYAARFSETYNDIESCGEDVAVPTFKLGLPIDSEQFIRLEEDKSNNSTVQTEAPIQSPNIKPSAQTNKIPKVTSVPSNFVSPSFKAHSTVFKEPIYRILEKIKGEPFFMWPPKMPGDPAAWNQRPMCSYHRERGHLTGNCYKLKSHLEQLVSDGHLSEYVNLNLTKQEKMRQNNDRPRSSGTAPTGVIHVILSPLCTSISPASYRSDLQKALHLRQSYGISDSAHLVPKFCSEAHGSSVNGTISFSDSDLHDVQLPHNDPLVITLRIGNYDVKRVLVDQGSFAEVMYQELYEKLGLGKSDLSEFGSPMPHHLTMPLWERVRLHRMRAVPSTLHQKLRFPTKDGVMEINGDQVAAKQCVLAAAKKNTSGKVGVNLSLPDRDKLIILLREFRDIFAWSVYEAPGVSPDLACHSLAIPPDSKPVQQRHRKLAPERSEIIMEEVRRLLAAEAIRPVLYPTWLSNTVVVQKKNGKWRVCVDFTDLNKVCPKDHFPLPRIDQLVDSAAGHDRMSFLDAFQGYHQIPMTPSDQEKTAFITPRGAYCYKVMPFGLKNAGATYQRMVTTMFGSQIGKTVEVYIDDMLVKSVRKEDHLAHLREVFEILRRDKLRLNASKCLFGVHSRKFLGHIISNRGIEANPDQISALINLEEPKNTKQVQRLT
uniref:Reverse transcriptase domain-containing protein n=1 Tax=Fagus sylvatica TaxID=28930 RepID=A0A2N9GYD0_FAGSY